MANRTRRDFFSSMVDGLHGTALATLLGADLFSAARAGASEPASHIYDLKPKAPQFPARAKSVIHLFMNGGPSQMDLFDPKPTLKRLAGTAPSRELSFAISNGKVAGTLFPSPFEFKRAGKCGMEISDMLPHLPGCADDIALIRSMYGEHANHEPALFLMHTGRTIASRPSMGAWVAYGLGTENQNLPAYVVLDDPKGLPINGISNWQSAWLPPIYQGTRFRAEGTPVLNLEPRAEVPAPLVEAERNLLRKLDEAHRKERPYQPELDARISSYELSARMQLAASDALDVNKETEATREAYGLNDPLTASYGKRCLMARRLVERGVRFVQLYIESQIFDTHGDLQARPAIRVRQDRQAGGGADQGSEAARPAGFHADRVGRGIRAPADFAGRRQTGPRPWSERLQRLDGRRRHQGRHRPRRHRRHRVQSGGESGERARFPRHDSAPAWD